jgi:hypothetical protein
MFTASKCLWEMQKWLQWLRCCLCKNRFHDLKYKIYFTLLDILISHLYLNLRLFWNVGWEWLFTCITQFDNANNYAHTWIGTFKLLHFGRWIYHINIPLQLGLMLQNIHLYRHYRPHIRLPFWWLH